MNLLQYIRVKAATGCLFSSRCKLVVMVVLVCNLSMHLHAQEPQAPDTIVSLSDVVVKAFGSGLRKLAVPASVSVVKDRDLYRFTNTSLVPVFNIIPGVRMEERSPGSYRLSIRGSLIRSPFGVRNVKVYLDDIILTDAGGNTYLNLLDLNMLSGIEVIRGPAGSVYGSGTSGVVHFSIPQINIPKDSAVVSNTARIQVIKGSLGQYSHNIRKSFSWHRHQLTISQGTNLADGYRDNSRLQRDVLQANWDIGGSNGSRYRVFMFTGGLSYQTPGGLTFAQQTANPRQARPATPTLPSAEAQRAGINNRTALAGFSASHQVSSHWQWKNAATLSYTHFENPFISNYEKRKESNLGLRSVMSYHRNWVGIGLTWVTGLEWQKGFYTIDSSGNAGGIPDQNMVRDRVDAAQAFVFSQSEVQLPYGIRMQAGLSLNQFTYDLKRVIGAPAYPISELGFLPQPAPRLALLWAPVRMISIHASLSRGFSPPSLAEVRPSAGGFSSGLQAEHGWNKEVGLKGAILRNRIQFDATVFDFSLTNAIVRRSNASGAEFFINAGGTRQRGLEMYVEAYPVQNMQGLLVRQLRIWNSLAISDFRFENYSSGAQSFSNNKITGVPDQTLNAGVDLFFPGGLYLMGSAYHSSRLPLTDANDAFADPFTVWQARLGWRGLLSKHMSEIFLAGDNLTNQHYSSGNDLNAFGRRFYNPAPGRNVIFGIRMDF